jgi:hypothetical protein
MRRKNILFLYFLLSIFILFSCSPKEKEMGAVSSSEDYEDIVTLFKEFREFHKPRMTNGIPDYSDEAMEKKRQGLKRYQDLLAAIDTSSWPISQKVDYLLVRSEMNGMDFYHRVLKPWSTNSGNC